MMRGCFEVEGDFGAVASLERVVGRDRGVTSKSGSNSSDSLADSRYEGDS